MNSYFLSGYIVGQAELFRLGTASDLGEGKVWIETNCTLLKISSFIASCTQRKSSVNMKRTRVCRRVH